MDSLGIAIDGGRYVRIDSQIGDLPRNVRLRTLKAGQGSALLEFCRFRKGSPRKISSYRLSELNQDDNQIAEIRLRIERRSFAVWEVRISRDRTAVETVRIRTRIGLWPLVIAAAGLFALLLWFLLSGSLSTFGKPASYPRETVQVVNETSSDEETPESTGDIDSAIENETPTEIDSSVASDIGAVDDTSDDGVKTDDPQDSDNIETVIGTETADDPEIESNPVAVILPEPRTIYFEPESASLDAVSRNILDRLSAEIPAAAVITIEGHSADYGTERGQLALSRLRARIVADYLKAGLPSDTPIEVSGFGVANPATSDPKRQDLNRRVVITLRILEK